MAATLSQLLVRYTKTQIYNTALQVGKNVGLPVDSWLAGDPTRSLYYVLAEVLEAFDEMVAGWIASAFLDDATGMWLKILAKQVYNVDVPEATYAATTVTLTNSGGGYFEIEANDLTFRNTTTGKTYRNSSAGTLTAGGTLDLDVVAEEAGSDSSASAGEIDDLVTALLGVTCANASAAIGTDEQSEATTRQQCRDKLGSLSPNGPPEAYAFVARNKDLTGSSAVTRVRVYSESETGDVTVYLAGPSGAVGSDVRTAVENAIVLWANPLCNTPTVLAATNVTQAITYTLWVYKSANKTSAEIQADVAAALQELFADHPIGGDIITPGGTGYMYKSLIESTIRGALTQAFRVSLSAPAADLALANNEVAVLGTVTPTINLVDDP